MTNYTKTTDFAAKDALPSGNSAKIVKGSEIDTEFNNIATASATKANANAAALTGTTTFETISDGTIAITAFVDEDNMASDSATLLPTQQSVKAYVDSQVTAQDLDVTDGSTSIDIDLDSESLGILGGTGIDSTASGTGVTLAIDSTVATLTGSQTLSNKTLSAPVVSGNLTTDGLLDGRDVATDGTKLDGIESGATADQTAAEIKTAYESNADTNAFTDADESKLDGIEASADVTDTANVTAAGALMDSELTSEASVKALNQGVATTDSPTFAGLTTTADVSFGDNDKAIFGAGSDLQIYHNGSNSFIEEAGTGSLYVRANTDFRVQSYSDNEEMIRATANGAVTLYNNNSAKLATTSTGIDVTGTATMDGLTVDGDALVKPASGSAKLYLQTSNTTSDSQLIFGDSSNNNVGGVKYSHSNDAMRFETSGAERLRIDSSGIDVTGTVTATAGAFESTGATEITLEDTDGGFAASKINVQNGGRDLKVTVPQDIIFNVGSSDAVTILNGGNVGIGAGIPAKLLDVAGAIRAINSAGSSAAEIDITSGGTWRLRSNPTTGTNSYGLDIVKGSAGTDVKMSINSSGNVGIGTSSPTAGVKLHVANASQVNQYLESTGNTTNSILQTGADGNSAYVFNRANAALTFGTNNTERLRIDASGNLALGDSNAYTHRLFVKGVGTNEAVGLAVGTNGDNIIRFYNSSLGTAGAIKVNSGGTTVAYNTSSDQRLKENITDADDAGSKVDAIQVRKFDWIADGSHQDYGMIAQELQAVAPEAVSGDADSDEMMGVDYSKLVPMLVKEIQSLRARVAQLEN